MCRSIEPQGWSTNEIIRGTGTPQVKKVGIPAREA